ncbi:MAG: DUF4203 domain-containing protein [Dehalococcoidia bacterium]
MEDFLVGVIVLLLGAAVCFFGLRLFFILLPLWGFLVGFFIGAAGVEALFGDGFLGTAAGWIVGFVVGLVFALLSYIFWYVGALLAAASAGALIGSALMSALDVDTSWAVFLVALAGAILFGGIALLLNLPVLFVVVNTALAGAGAAVAGIMLIFDRIDRQDLRLGAAWALIEESWFWLAVWVVVAAVGLAYQLGGWGRTKLPDDRWSRAQIPA